MLIHGAPVPGQSELGCEQGIAFGIRHLSNPAAVSAESDCAGATHRNLLISAHMNEQD